MCEIFNEKWNTQRKKNCLFLIKRIYIRIAPSRTADRGQYFDHFSNNWFWTSMAASAIIQFIVGGQILLIHFGQENNYAKFLFCCILWLCAAATAHKSQYKATQVPNPNHRLCARPHGDSHSHYTFSLSHSNRLNFKTSSLLLHFWYVIKH